MRCLRGDALTPCPCLPGRRPLYFGRAPQSGPWRGISLPQTERSWHDSHRTLQHQTQASTSSSLGAEGAEPDDEPPELSVFPRIRERDPYRRLGVANDAPFDEVQDAYNYLHQAYRWHEGSREAIELALDSILGERYKTRNKLGYRPPSTKNKKMAGPEAAPKLTFKERLQNRLEPSVPATTIVNEGAIFLALGAWAAVQAGTADPSLPIVAAAAYSIWVFVKKRKNRTPDGPFFGNNPFWGAAATTLAVLLGGAAVCAAVVYRLPLPRSVHPQAVLLFLMTAASGAACIWLK